MAKETQLEIIWTGPLPSLERHRVSLSAFSDPLCHLLAAARRIASNMVSDALEPADTGRLAKEAHQIDIEIGGVVGNSSGVSTFMTFQPPDLGGAKQQPLFNLLTENVGNALIDALEAESQGNLKNSGVRRYLQSLPSILTRQSYRLHENGRAIRHIVIDAMHLPEALPELPFLCEVIGSVIGVGFEPGRPEVKFKSEDGALVTIVASANQVEKALELRSARVRALILRHGLKSRLMSMEDTSTPPFRANPEIHLFRKWDGLLRRLAQ